jgi:SAM-dependent methyltransferase
LRRSTTLSTKTRCRAPLPPRSLEDTYEAYSRSRRKQRQWAADNPGNIAIRAELLATVLGLAAGQLEQGGRILDLGCGGGWLLGELAERGVGAERLHGVDLIESRVEAARRRVPGAQIEVADARALPFEAGRFDLVAILTALSSMPAETIPAALGEARRVVAEGGLVLCYEPRFANPFNRATSPVPTATLEASLGPASATASLTGFPPLARRLGAATEKTYPALARVAPTHRVTAHEQGVVRRPRG